MDRLKIAGVGLVAASLFLAGCAHKKDSINPDVEVSELIQMLPGHYDNAAQVQSDIAKGINPPHEALTLDIVPIDAVMIGENVFYVQESITGDPRRVLGQKLVVIGVVRKDVVQTDFALDDPHRWRNGQLNPELFKGIMAQDVRSTKGCSLRWKRENGKFVGANEPKTCHGRAGGAGGIAQIEARAELGPEEYATSEQAFDKPGHLALGRGDDPFYRFHRATTDND